MRVLVTGGTGFVGTTIVRCLAEQNHDVVASGRSELGAGFWPYLAQAGAADKVSLAQVDVRDREALAEVLARYRPEAVVHAAVVTALTPSLERERAFTILETNLLGTANVLLAAASAGTRRAIYVSSPAVYAPGGVTDPPIAEDAPARPSALYGITKASSERIWLRLAEVHGLSAACVRIAQPYGPLERATASRLITSPIHEWVMAARSGQPLRVPAWPAGKDWTYVRDTGLGVAALVTAGTLGHDIYNLGVGGLWMVDQVIDTLRDLYAEIDVEVVSNPADINPNIAPTGLKGPLSIERIRDDLGFEPRYDIVSGLSEYSEWLDMEAAGNEA